jgi:hypothetical protein
MRTGRCATRHARQEKKCGSGGEISCGESELNVATQTAALPRTDCTRFRGLVAARIHALVARDCALLPAEGARGWRAGIAAGVLGSDRLGIRHILPFRRRPGPAALHGLLLSRRADHDRAVHLDLHHDVGHRGPQGRISALGDGGSGAALGNCAGQGSGRHNALRDSGDDLSDLCSVRGVHLDHYKSCWWPSWCFWFRSR